MCSSRNVIADRGDFGNFLEKLQTSVSLGASSPAARNTKAEINRRYHEAYEHGRVIGYADGFASGESKGLEVGLQSGRSEAASAYEDAHREELDAFATELAAIATNAKEAVVEWTQQAETRLAALAIEIAHRAIGEAVRVDEESVLAIAREVMAEVTLGTQVRLRVNPVDAAILESRRTEIMQALSQIRGLEVVPDSNVGIGCVLESDSGVVDARVESYLLRLSEHVRGDAA